MSAAHNINTSDMNITVIEKHNLKTNQKKYTTFVKYQGQNFKIKVNGGNGIAIPAVIGA